ncbi:carboxypeptidase regulatory-like domain-containing protein [Candidatus Dojkabacteria bacterium]|nr:carboxypeptidase regulatory-like domain-containing protein [Candidatus Dojkabacteria bacterium]
MKFSPIAQIFRNQEPSEEYCRATRLESTIDKEKPEIQFINIPKWWKLEKDSKLEVQITDNGNVDLNSLKIYPDQEGKEGKNMIIKLSKRYVTIDDENIDIEKTDSGYLVTFTPEEEFEDNWSYFFNAEVCDCSGNCSNTTIATSVCEDSWCVLNTIPLYIIGLLVWWFTVFGPTLVKRKYGIVYDSYSKTPIMNAVIRLYSKDGKLESTQVTDLQGVFEMKPTKGEYRIDVAQKDHIFPSQLAPLKIDGDKSNLYYGKTIIQKNDSRSLEINIPMDPRDDKGKVGSIEKFKTRAVSTFTLMNPIFIVIGALVPLILWGLDFAAVFYTIGFAIALVLIIIRKRLLESKVGIVIDQDNQPVPNIKLAMLDKYNNKIKEEITDQNGQYIFIVPGDKYQLKIISNDYKMKDSDKNIIWVGYRTKENITIGPKIKLIKI